MPEITFSKNGLTVENCLSSRDSSITKHGKFDMEVSLSESLSGQSRLDCFELAINIIKILSGVLPTHPGVQQGDVAEEKPIRLSATRATHLRYSFLEML